jgi:hypothetical protein
MKELEKNDQIAFRYCDANGNVSPDTPVTPNGSTGGIAGICNKEGNVVAIMPHPERTELGDRYFQSIRVWIENRKRTPNTIPARKSGSLDVHARDPMPVEIFIDTIITNNEERTVEQAARRAEPSITLKQYKYIGLQSDRSAELLSALSFFNPNKEVAYVRQKGEFLKWNSDKKKLEKASHPPLKGVSLLRRDEPDTGGAALGKGSETGVCYDCRNIDEAKLLRTDVCEVFCNPHSSILERMAK